MTVIKPTSKEQTIYFLLGNVSLGTYDKRFLQNIEENYICTHKPITTNQAKLLDKIITRYHRQLLKLEVNSEELISLQWNINPIDSLPQYTEVFLDVFDDMLVLRCPYKKEFVTDFKKNKIGARWDSESRFWYMPASTNSLKIVNDQIISHYSNINYCEKITEFFNIVNEYKTCKYWNPTYKYLAGNFMIVATNKWLDESLSQLEFDGKASTISKLVWHGVTIDDSVIKLCKEKYDNNIVDFAVSVNNESEINDVSLIDKLMSTEVDFVVIYFKLSRGNFAKQITELLEKNKIKFHIHNQDEIFSLPHKLYEHPVLLTDRSISTNESYNAKQFAKIIKIVNSKPITIK